MTRHNETHSTGQADPLGRLVAVTTLVDEVFPAIRGNDLDVWHV